MLLDIVLWIILAVALVTLIVLVARKSSTLTSINVKDVPAKRLEAIKTDIIEERIKRRIRPIISVTKKAAVPIGKVVSRGFSLLYGKLRSLEQQARRNRLAKKAQEGDEASTTDQVTKLIGEAESFAKEDEWQDAENRYIEVISIDPKNADAYYGLGEVYLELKDYEHARETFSFLVKLDEQDDRAYHELGLVAKALGNYEDAVRQFEQASKLAQNNPKYHASLVDIAILKGDKVLAWEYFDKLRSVNPENQKLDELKLAIEALERKTTTT